MNKTILLTCVALALLGFSVKAQTPLNDRSLPATAAKDAASAEGEASVADSKPKPYAWRILPPLGLTEPADMDTLPYNYAQQSVPANISPAYATTGNLGGPGENMIFFERPAISDFFFKDAVSHWLPSLAKERFYNTPIPMTLLAYNNSGGRDNSQDWLKADFSGNINKRAQVGAMFDYLYNKGAYDAQAVKSLSWGLSGSYMGERYEMQAFYNHWNLLGKENGGITNDLYITDPAELQGGQTSIQPKSIPTNLTDAFNRTVGGQLYMTNTYKLGFTKEVEIDDTTTVEEFVPVSSINWTLNYEDGRHMFRDNAKVDNDFWEHTYLDMDTTNDRTSYWSLSNTVGLSLLEEFNKFAKFGLSAFATHQIRKFTQTTDTIDRVLDLPEGITPYPGDKIPHKESENLLWVGGQLTKQHGSLLTYEATARFGLLGSAIGDVSIEGNVGTRFKLLGDTVSLRGYGYFKNEEAPYLLKKYVSNHFIWDNDFGKIRRVRLGGELIIPHTRTRVNVGVENLQNYIYFDSLCMPVQAGSNVQVFSVNLRQNFKFGPLHWDNNITYQTSSNQAVIPLPKFAVYTNLYLQFKVAKVLDVQLGVDCDYYTKYKAVSYQPATMAFYNQDKIECGDYPFMNAYVNMKLSRVRFYVLMSHVNQGMTGTNYFSMPHYPLNPRKFQIGLSIDFPN